ncbi:hypothetical protein ABIE27_003581 [Paenibacillus sp. 4624]|uniref:hypothetical protein n=1 Tax=Paenibacillus sp. 4624 TaxID=3156453 RepID=UPI003D23816D
MKSDVVTYPTQLQSYKSNPKWKRTVANILLVASLSFTTISSVSTESSLPLPQETESFINQFFTQPEVKSALKGAVVKGYQAGILGDVALPKKH